MNNTDAGLAEQFANFTRAQGVHETGGFIRALISMLLLFVLGTLLIRRVNRLGWGGASGLALLLSLTTAYLMMPAMRAEFTRSSSAILPPLWLTFCASSLPTFGVPFAVMLVQKWFGSACTPLEKQQGMAGISSWITVPRLFWIVYLSVGISVWTSCSTIMAVIGLLLLLVAAPVWRTISPEVQTTASLPPADPFQPEREQVLNMISEKLVTPEEGADLLNALAASQAANSQPPDMTASRRLMFAGAAMVFIGFFLPWFRINIGAEVSRLANGMSINANSQLSQLANAVGVRPGELPQIPSFGRPLETVDTLINGSQVASGLGWAVLFLSMSAVAIPFFAQAMRPRRKQACEAIALGLGSFLLLYLAAGSLRFVTFGLFVVICGYVIEVAGAARDWKGGAVPLMSPA